MVHSSFEFVENPDIIIPIIIEDKTYEIYVQVRPGIKEFITELSKFYELVIFTASISEVILIFVKIIVCRSFNFFIRSRIFM